MCGIAGIISQNIELNGKTPVIKEMIDLLSHRGPDFSNYKIYSNAILGHSRLSIIDLSNNASQPFESNGESYSIVFNGEIYNYLELKKELSQKYNFKTSSDTEVLLAAYIVWGESCLDKLNGMFSFCIYNLKTKSSFFARDRFGQKPFFYSLVGKTLIFSSEIKPILSAGIEAKPNLKNIHQYLTKSLYDHNNETFFENIFQLLPGECATFDSDSILKIKKYYDLSNCYGRLKTLSEGDTIERLNEMLLNMGQIHMRSDVPIGVSLSGGLDSSALLSIFKLSNNLNGSQKCFSVDFGNDLSEKKWMKSAADFYNLPIEIYTYTNHEFLNYLSKMMWHQEAPIGGLLNSALERVMFMARSNNIKVIQDGCGIDEGYAGYRNFHNIYVGTKIKNNEPDYENAISDYSKVWNISKKETIDICLKELDSTTSAIDGTTPERTELLNKDFINLFESQDNEILSGKNLYDEQVKYLQNTKIPRGVRMKDRISMAHGIELRCPFLDHRFIEFGLSINQKLYFKNGYSKYIIRKSLEGIMDNNVLYAPKRSINAPQGSWFTKSPMKEFINDMIGSVSFDKRGLFDTKKVKREFSLHNKELFPNSFFIWQWINIELWFQTFIDNNPCQKKLPLWK